MMDETPANTLVKALSDQAKALADDPEAARAFLSAKDATAPARPARKPRRASDDARSVRVTFRNGQSGRLFRVQESRRWKMAFFLHGKEYRETTGKTDFDEARKVLKDKLDELASVRQGRTEFVPPKAKQLTVDDALTALKTHFEAARKKGLKQAKAHMAAVRQTLGTAKAIAVTPALVDHCITRWQAQGVADATINRRTQLLGQALRQARIGNVPTFTRLVENNARQGTVAREAFGTIVAALPEHLRDLARFGYATGWRRGEILGLTAADVNLRRGVLTLADSKNGDPRVIPLRNEDGTPNAVGEIIERRMAARVVKNPKNTSATTTPYLWHKRGRPVRHFTKAWRKACRAAGLPDLKFHDLRRTFATDAAEAGNDYASIMAWTGHRTLSMFLRYRIRTLTGMQRAAARVETFRETQTATPAVVPIERAREAEAR